MRDIFVAFLAGFALLGSLANTSITASAQTITIGGDDGQVMKILGRNGYTDARIVKRGLTIIRAEACKGADKYRVKISVLGKITSTNKIGTCAVAATFSPRDAEAMLLREGFTQPKANARETDIYATACRGQRKVEFSVSPHSGKIQFRRAIGKCTQTAAQPVRPVQPSDNDDVADRIARQLTDQGYRRVVVTDAELPRYGAEACRDNDRVRLVMNRRGRIRSERIIGKCERQFDPDNMTAVLEKKGYDRIKAVETRRPPYIANACKGADKMEIVIGRFGRLRDERRIGPCATPIDPAKMANVLSKEGFDRVRVLRSNRTPYLAEACKGTTLVELTVGRYGKIRKEERVGRCASPATEASLQEKLEGDGYLNINLARKNNGWRAEVCREENKMAIRFDAYGDVVRERNIGECKSQTVLDVLKNLENRGAKKTSMQIVGCFKGTQYRWMFDRLGNRTGRERLGGCR